MWRGLKQWRSLPAGERRQFLFFAAVQPVISLALRVRGFCRTLTWLERHGGNRSPHAATAEELATARRTAELAAIAGRRGPVATSCLRQSLAVHLLLRRRGLNPQIKFGVDKLGVVPDMHAWVELEGVALAQPGLRHAQFQRATSAITASTTESN